MSLASSSGLSHTPSRVQLDRIRPVFCCADDDGVGGAEFRDRRRSDRQLLVDQCELAVRLCRFGGNPGGVLCRHDGDVNPPANRRRFGRGARGAKGTGMTPE